MRTVLIVVDDPNTSRLLADLARALGCEVREAELAVDASKPIDLAPVLAQACEPVALDLRGALEIALRKAQHEAIEQVAVSHVCPRCDAKHKAPKYSGGICSRCEPAGCTACLEPLPP